MRQATIDHSTSVAVRSEGDQGMINFDLAEVSGHNAAMPDENRPQGEASNDEGNFVILDDTVRRYSGTKSVESGSDAYLEGCLRILQSIVGHARQKQTRQR